LFFIFVVGIITLWIVLFWGNSYYQKKRRDAFAKAAEALGLECYFDLTKKDWLRLEQFELYKKRGRSQSVGIAVVAETDSTRMTVCEYTYVVSNGKQTSRHTSTVQLVVDPILSIPKLAIERRSWTAALSKIFGYRYIEFPEDPNFNNRYLVRGTSEDEIRAFLTDRRRSALIDNFVEGFEGTEACFMIVNPGVWLQPSDLEPRFAQALAVLNGIL
jgi:hypothetical protein